MEQRDKEEGGGAKPNWEANLGFALLATTYHTIHRYRLKITVYTAFDVFLIAVIRGVLVSYPLLQFITYTHFLMRLFYIMK